jgi:hypothetical protein
MAHSPTPWIGLAALIVMFVLPLLPDWLFEGARTIKHRPRRHICGDCGEPWAEGHNCAPRASAASYIPLRAELQRAKQPRTDGRGAIIRPRAR